MLMDVSKRIALGIFFPMFVTKDLRVSEMDFPKKSTDLLKGSVLN